MHTQTAELIRECRQQEGLTQRQLGEKCRMSQANISRLESGKYNGCMVNTLKIVAGAMGRRLVMGMERD